jgi:hypothetical protein
MDFKMAHLVAERSRADNLDQASRSRRFVQNFGDWSFVAITWVMALAILRYPTLNVIGLIGFAIYALFATGSEGNS